MVTFSDTSAPKDLRLERALEEMKRRLGEKPPTRALYAELASKYDVTEEELGRKWIEWGFR